MRSLAAVEPSLGQQLKKRLREQFPWVTISVRTRKTDDARLTQPSQVYVAVRWEFYPSRQTMQEAVEAGLRKLNHNGLPPVYSLDLTEPQKELTVAYLNQPPMVALIADARALWFTRYQALLARDRQSEMGGFRIGAGIYVDALPEGRGMKILRPSC